MINFFKNSDTPTHKTLELIKDQFARYEINLQRSTAFLHTVIKKLDNAAKMQEDATY